MQWIKPNSLLELGYKQVSIVCGFITLHTLTPYPPPFITRVQILTLL